MRRKDDLKRALRQTFEKSRLSLFLTGISLLFMGGILFLYEGPMEAFFYSAFVCCFLLIVNLAVMTFYSLRSCQKRSRMLFSLENLPGELGHAESLLEEDYQKVVRGLALELEHLSMKRENEQRELVDYYAAWVHQIKTPIAVMKLLLADMDTDESRALAVELFRIEEYARMALNYTRIGSDSKDLVIESHDLDGLIRQSVRKFAPLFVQRRLRLLYESTSLSVVTDQKWFGVILDQLLSNAIKYTPRGSISIRAEQSADLSQTRIFVSDEGIGIAAEDVPRIFEKGFTGMNGRSEDKSTGIGLYLAKKAADMLMIGLAVESKPGCGSSFILTISNSPERIFL